MEQVILVNDADEEIGVMEKMKAHYEGVLHRAFSIFIFNNKGEMLLQQRANNKYHSGGLWTNACCSHPKPNEATIDAAERRLQEELGFSASLKKIFDFTYQTSFDNGLTEHEFDHVFTGIYDGEVNLNRTEVQDFCYRSLDDIQSAIESHPQKFTTWFKIAFPLLRQAKTQAA